MSIFTRRQSLGLLVGLSSIGLPQISLAQSSHHDLQGRKFIFVILRGAMDGLSALIPDDAQVEALRGHILPSFDQRLNLGNGFRLHPSFKGLQNLYANGQAAFIHAAATPYRARSHFEGQDALETLSGPGEKEGWLNRALMARGDTGLAVGRVVPLAFKGPAPVTNWSPPIFKLSSDDVLARLSDLYKSDDLFAAALSSAQESRAMDVQISKREARRFTREFAVILSSIGRLMSVDENAPNIGMVALDGWDTHYNQINRLGRQFADLDAGLAGLKASLGSSWDKTCVVVCSEFGRTAAANGTEGTDHGTGGVVMLLGGAVKGGRVHGDWPGLKQAALYEDRDLFPANEIPAILKGVMRDHLGIDRSALDSHIFPHSGRAFDGLIKT